VPLTAADTAVSAGDDLQRPDRSGPREAKSTVG
jgi:hypothetical protein